MHALRKFTAAIAFAFGANGAFACTCFGEEIFTLRDGWAVEILNAKAAVVHARVVEVLANGNAKIEAIRWFKGDRRVPVLTRDMSNPSCVIRFGLGEEFVYVLDRHASVQLCDRLNPSAPILDALEEMLKPPTIPEAREP